ncbi:JAB domain-containing protein [bacterium]|nr:MAG: JAB domain-containing protein [bacterium]
MKEESRTILSWPGEERPREKLLAMGPGALCPAELLAILIRTGSGGGRTAVDVGRDLWKLGGESWEGLLKLTAAEIAAVKGMGLAKAASILASLEISRRVGDIPLRNGSAIADGRDVYRHFAGKLSYLEKENFYCLLLDTKNRVLREERISEGTLNESLVHPREAFRAAVREGAAGVVFVHNHPSGDPSPSREDVELTSRLMEAGKLLGIRFLDHVIVARSGYYSFAKGK